MNTGIFTPNRPVRIFGFVRAQTALLSLLFFFWAAKAPAAVGYVNVALTNGYTFVANPLDFPPNALTNLVPNPPVGSRAYFWDVTNQIFLPAAMFGSSGWDRNYDMPVARGVVIYAPLKFTNTFVGYVAIPSTNIVKIAGSNKFSLVGCPLPVGGPLSSSGQNTVNFPRIDGATALFFRPNQTFDSYMCFTNFGWSDPTGIEPASGPNLGVATSIFVQNPGPDTNWVVSVAQRLVPPVRPPSVEILRVSVQEGIATLGISNRRNVLFDVQFSTNGENWRTVAANQSGDKWTGPLPDPVQGQFQVIASQTEGGAK